MATATATRLNSPSVRFSTYSGAPSIHPSIAPTMDSNPSNQPVDSARNTIIKDSSDIRSPSIQSSSTSDARADDLKEWADVFERMSNPRLEKQRFVPSAKKAEEIQTIALGAKLERALGRRMEGQDATFKRREPLNEKVAASS